jgi:Lon protease-like protein
MSAALPEILSVFPLPGILLLPRGELPLRLFEPRYVDLLLDCLGEGRLMGVVQTLGNATHPVPDDAPLHKVGCLGRVSGFMESGEGAFLVTLTGVSRFAILAEAESRKGYRRFRVGYADFAADVLAEGPPIGNRRPLLETARSFLAARGLEADWKAMEATPDTELVASLAMGCPFAPQEKQALLECPTTIERAALLQALLEMGAATPPDSEIPTIRH